MLVIGIRVVVTCDLVASVGRFVVGAAVTVVKVGVVSAGVESSTQKFGSASSSIHSLRSGSNSMRLQVVCLQIYHL